MIEQALESQLKNDVDVAAIVSTRVFPVILPATPTFPAVTYTLLTGDRTHSMDGPSGLASPSFQVDSWASTYSSVKDLASKVRIALDGLKGTVSSVEILGVFIQSEKDLYDGTNSVYRVSSVFIFHHKEN